MRAAPRSGFTLVELMVVVAILGLLAAIAIPAYQRYLVKSKATEAPMLLRKIMDGATAYFAVEHADSAGQLLVAQFPASTDWYPAQLPAGAKVMPTDPSPADQETWNQLRFTLTAPVQFHYQFLRTGVGLSSRADAIAESQLTAGHTCRYERAAWTKGGDSLELELSDLKVTVPPF